MCFGVLFFFLAYIRCSWASNRVGRVRAHASLEAVTLHRVTSAACCTRFSFRPRGVGFLCFNIYRGDPIRYARAATPPTRRRTTPTPDAAQPRARPATRERRGPRRPATVSALLFSMSCSHITNVNRVGNSPEPMKRGKQTKLRTQRRTTDAREPRSRGMHDAGVTMCGPALRSHSSHERATRRALRLSGSSRVVPRV